MLRRLLHRLRRDDRGATAIAIAGSMSVLLTFAGLGTEFAMYGVEYRRMQGAADAAAFAGAARRHYGDETAVVPEATAVAALHGYVSGDGTTVEVDPAYLSNDTVRVRISLEKSTFLLRFAGMESYPIRAEATATAEGAQEQSSSGGPCLLTLASSGVGIHFQGNVTFNMANCSFATNSASSNSIQVTGGAATINAQSGTTAGGVSDAQGRLPPNVSTYAGITADPWAHLQLPPIGTQATACGTQGNRPRPESLSGTINLSADRIFWCGAELSANTTINANGYNLIFVNGDLDIGNKNLTVNNGTLVFTDAQPLNSALTPRRVGTILSNGQAQIRLSPPNHSRPLDGIVIMQKKQSNVTVAELLFGGGTRIAFDGLIYMPDGQFRVQGGGNGGSPCATGVNVCSWQTTCNKVVAATLHLAGNAGFNSQCENVPGANPPSGIEPPPRPRLTG